MNHPTEDDLLLLAYGDLPEPRVADLESHVAACSLCAEQLAGLERARVALDLAVTARPRRSAILWAAMAGGGALAVAAVLVVMLVPKASTSDEFRGWSPTTSWSATAGYVAGGKAMVEIDAQLTRLEQERFYGRP